ncbi:MAG: caspase family protein [Gallionella sp.]|nr:caspase family protein [Gallionella sp.]
MLSLMGRKSVVWTSLMLALGCAGDALAVDKALIVGVGNYQLPSANLKGIDLDVKMASDMALYMGIAPENIHVVMDENATLGRVKEQMTWLSQNVSDKDRVFFYFSGHGTQVPDKNNDEGDGLDEAMVLHDIDGKSYNGLYVDDDFGAALKRIPSQNMVVMVDACHSGTGTKSWGSSGNSFNVNEGQMKFLNLFNVKPNASHTRDYGVSEKSTGEDNYLAIAAAQDNQQSIATRRGSLFTVAFRDAFDEERSKGNFSLQKVFKSTEARLANSGVKFQPNLSGNMAIANNTMKVASNTGDNISAETATPSTPAVSATPRNGPLWNKLSKLLVDMPVLDITAPSVLLNGEKTEFTIDIPAKGYLNVVMVGPTDNGTVLFPNSFAKDNRVEAGKFTFPTAKMGFKITAMPPYGKTMVVAFLSQEPLNLLEEGFGNRDSSGKTIRPFAHVTESGIQAVHKTRDLGVSADTSAPAATASNGNGFWGGKKEIEIKEK